MGSAQDFHQTVDAAGARSYTGDMQIRNYRTWGTVLIAAATLTVLGWETASVSPLPDDESLAGGHGIVRHGSTDTVSAHLHSLRGVAHPVDGAQRHTDLDNLDETKANNELADGSDFGGVTPTEDILYEPAQNTHLSLRERDDQGLRNKDGATARFLEKSQRGLMQGRLGDRIAEANEASGSRRESLLGSPDTDASRLDFGDGFSLQGDDMKDTGGDTDDAYVEGYNNYLYDRMSDGAGSIQFDSLDGFESYIPAPK